MKTLDNVIKFVLGTIENDEAKSRLVKIAVDTYCNGVEAFILGFNETADSDEFDFQFVTREDFLNFAPLHKISVKKNGADIKVNIRNNKQWFDFASMYGAKVKSGSIKELDEIVAYNPSVVNKGEASEFLFTGTTNRATTVIDFMYNGIPVQLKTSLKFRDGRGKTSSSQSDLLTIPVVTKYKNCDYVLLTEYVKTPRYIVVDNESTTTIIKTETEHYFKRETFNKKLIYIPLEDYISYFMG